MSFRRFLSLVTIVSIIFSAQILAMSDEEEGYTSPSTSRLLQKEDEPCCQHRGLAHWVGGIGEYFTRIFCCGADKECLYPRETRKYRKTDYRGIVDASDCFCVDTAKSCCGYCGVCDNPALGILCCPFITLGHVCCLPCACKDTSNYSQEFSILSPRTPSVSPTPYVPPEPPKRVYKRRKASPSDWSKGEVWRTGGYITEVVKE